MVDAKKFDQMLATLSSLGRVVTEKRQMRDVTESFVVLRGRMNQAERDERFFKMMAEEPSISPL